MSDAAWYHGTSTRSGLEVGDDLDPSRGAFEPCVWVTSSVEHAREFAVASAALGGSPVIFAVEISGTTEQDDGEADYAGARRRGVDALIFEVGERGAPEAAILSRATAYLTAVIE